jgi:MFS family permease
VRLLADTRPLRESPPFRRLWLGTALSLLGGMMTGFAVPLQVYRITGSTFAVGALGLAVVVPTLLVGLLGGSLADAVDRRSLVLVTSSLLALLSIVLAVQAFAGLGSVALLYAVVTAQSLVAALDNPARRTFLPRLLRPHLLPAGAALTSLAFQLALFGGPALAGLVTGAFGLRTCYLLDALSFAGALYGVARLPPMPPLGTAARPGLRAVAAGLRYVTTNRVLAGVFLGDLVATVLGMPFALLPAVNQELFGGDPRTLGLLAAAPGAGGLLASALSGPVGHVTRQGRALLISVTVWGVAVAGFGLSHVLWLSLLLLALAGAADVTSVVFRTTIVQVTTPDELRGRVSAVDYVVGAGGPQLGNLRAGTVGTLTSPLTAAVTGGLAVIAGAGLLALSLPPLRRYRAVAATPPP